MTGKISYQEMKILRFNKIKEGKNAKEAYAEVADTIKAVNKFKYKRKDKEVDFKSEFKKIKNGN